MGVQGHGGLALGMLQVAVCGQQGGVSCVRQLCGVVVAVDVKMRPIQVAGLVLLRAWGSAYMVAVVHARMRVVVV